MKLKKIFSLLLLAISPVVLAFLFILFLTIVEYRPKPVEDVPFTSGKNLVLTGEEYSILSWNIGYAGLGKDEDFFMDGGKKVRPESKAIVENYLSGILNTMRENPSEIVFVQEIDVNSKRSYKINQYDFLMSELKKNGAFAYNFKCAYVPFPVPAIGHVESGLAVLSNFKTTGAQRISLPVPFKWPVRIANLKRAVLAVRIPVYNDGNATGKELVLADFHLEAFDHGEGKAAQTAFLKNFLASEYQKGNYVIAGGDFNQRFPGSDAFPPVWSSGWLPGRLEPSILDDGWSFVYDDSKPTCRSNAAPYNTEAAQNHQWQYHVIDGFLISPNVRKISVCTIDEDFQNSDHNPVFFKFILE